jgi:hypothetical protein
MARGTKFQQKEVEMKTGKVLQDMGYGIWKIVRTPPPKAVA